VTPKGFDWLPGNQLIYAADRGLYVSNQASAQGQLWATFSEEEGQPDHLAVSPDGDRLALTLKTAVNWSAIHGTVWIVNLDASGYVQLATTPDTDDPNTAIDDPVINFPMWSPDGRWIAVIEGAIGIINPPSRSEGYGSKLYIVPSDGENIMLTLNGPTEAIPVYSYYDEIATPGVNAELTTKFTTLVNDGGFAWID
jgi:Tol biopolymer transport system component